ncbi:MAG: hypothetical protein HY926_05585, partial [Elusimicrobia bacterium]|nr:hypothetical protein [Elusimicrobiota bacterium]
MSRSSSLVVFILLAAPSQARAASVAAASAAQGRAGIAPITALGQISIRGGLGAGLVSGQDLRLTGPLSAAVAPGVQAPAIATPALPVLSPAAPAAPAVSIARLGQLAEAAAPHIAAAMDAKSGAEASQGAAAALLEPLAKPTSPVAAEAAPAQEPLVKDISFDDGLPSDGGTTKHMRRLLLDSLSRDPAAWKREFSRLGIDLTRGEPRFRVLRTDMQLMGKESGRKKADFYVDLAYNIQLTLSGGRRSRVRVLLNAASGELRAFAGGTQRSEPLLRKLSFAPGLSLEERSLLNESLRRRKTAWSRGLTAARFSLLGRSPSIKVLSV